MPKPLVVSRSRTYPVAPDEAFARTLVIPLEQLFDRRYGPLPPIRRTDQDGEWGVPGQRRTIHTADGGTMREHLVAVEPPGAFRYEISDMTGPMKPIIGRVEGAWTFVPAGTGTRVTWTWTIHPRSAATALVMPVLGRLWRGYARQALERLEELLLG